MYEYRKWFKQDGVYKYILNDIYTVLLTIPYDLTLECCVVYLISVANDTSIVIESTDFHVNPKSSIECIQQDAFYELMQCMEAKIGVINYLYNEVKEAYNEVFICN